jgi:hypothetical protein
LSCQQFCETYAAGACGVSGVLNGELVFEGWCRVDFDPETNNGTGIDTNCGIITITAPDGSTAVVPFQGETNSQSVSGRFEIGKKTGTGEYDKLKGEGSYADNAGLVFTVTFAGKLKGLPKE